MINELINKKEDNLIFAKLLNDEDFINFKDIILNYLNHPQIKIEQKYDLLFSNAISKNCFKEIVRQLEIDFKKCFILWKLTEKISYFTTLFFTSSFKKGNGLKILKQIFILKQVFLAQLRYNANIWMTLDSKQTQKIQSKNDSSLINYKLLLLIGDFSDINEVLFLMNSEQKEILNLILHSNKIEDFVNLKQKISINLFNYLPINMMLLQSQKLYKKSRISGIEKTKLSYVAFMQMFCIFVEENLSYRN